MQRKILRCIYFLILWKFYYGEPHKIYVSIPMRTSYDHAIKLLDDPHVTKMLEKHQKNLGKEKPVKSDWYEEYKPYVKEYSERLKKVLPGMFAKWQEKLGVRVNKVSIKDTRSQWGSYNVKNHNISISIWLGEFPEACIGYVVVHELVHLLERGHNARFYGYLEKYYPGWKKCREKLRGKESEK